MKVRLGQSMLDNKFFQNLMFNEEKLKEEREVK